MFSVVIPLYHKELSITNTLQSVLDQTFKEFEVVIVNDGSRDNSLEKVKAFNDNRIRIINQENEGVSRARNRGIKEAKYEWVAFLDADDLWMDSHLKTFRENILLYPAFKAFCNTYTMSNQKQVCIDIEPKIIIVKDYFKEGLENFFFWTGVVCIHKSLFDEVGYFNEQLTRGEDIEIWMNIGRGHPIVWSNKVTALYNQDSENKLTRTNIPIDKCFESYLDFRNKSVSEIKYLQMLANGKIISLIKQLNFFGALKLVIKYNFNLIKKS